MKVTSATPINPRISRRYGFNVSSPSVGAPGLDEMCCPVSGTFLLFGFEGYFLEKENRNTRRVTPIRIEYWASLIPHVFSLIAFLWCCACSHQTTIRFDTDKHAPLGGDIRTTHKKYFFQPAAMWCCGSYFFRLGNKLRKEKKATGRSLADPSFLRHQSPYVRRMRESACLNYFAALARSSGSKCKVQVNGMVSGKKHFSSSQA